MERAVGNLSVLNEDTFSLIIDILSWVDCSRLHSVNRYFRIFITNLLSVKCGKSKAFCSGYRTLFNMSLSKRLHTQWKNDRKKIISWEEAERNRLEHFRKKYLKRPIQFRYIQE